MTFMMKACCALQLALEHCNGVTSFRAEDGQLGSYEQGEPLHGFRLVPSYTCH